MFELHVLCSGSKGNAAIVEDVGSGHGVLIDCGICKRDLLARAGQAQFDLSKLDAIFITHDHSDHTKGLGVVVRALVKLGMRPKIYALPPVQDVCKPLQEVKDDIELLDITLDESIDFGTYTVKAFQTSHDAAASCGFRFQGEDDILGYVTDTGFLSDEMLAALSDSRILALESNHDEKMLADGEYPYYLKQRIASQYGHLSNKQAAEALLKLASYRLEHVVAMHLSQNNNLPSLAQTALTESLVMAESNAHLQCASQTMLVSTKADR